MLQEFPLSIQLSFALAVAFILLSWSISTIQAVRAKKYLVLAVFPLTQPFLALFRLFASGKANKVPGCLILCALLLFGLGPIVAEKLERNKFLSWVDQLKTEGYPIGLESTFAKVQEVPDNENIWMSPFLKPLYSYSERLSEPESENPSPVDDINSSLERYDIFEIDESTAIRKFEKDDRATFVSGSNPFQNLLGKAIHVTNQSTSAQDKLNQQPNLELKPAAKVLLDFYQTRQESFDQLQSALSREQASFYYNLDGHPSYIMLPHLMYLKRFSIALNTRLLARLIHNESEAAWQDWKTLLLLLKAQDQDADLLITRLVQTTQYQILIETLQAAQALDAWDASKWEAIENDLLRWDVRRKMFNTLKTEMAYITATGIYTVNHPPSNKDQLRNEVGNVFMMMDSNSVMNGDDSMTNFQLDLWSIISPASLRALIDSKLRSGLSVNFSEVKTIIEAIKATGSFGSDEIDQSSESSLITFEYTKPKPSNSSNENQSLLPFRRLYEKFLVIDTRVKFAILACRLEQYKKINGEYPDNLDSIQSSELEMVNYEKTSATAFTMEIDLPDWFEKTRKVTWVKIPSPIL